MGRGLFLPLGDDLAWRDESDGNKKFGTAPQDQQHSRAH